MSKHSAESRTIQDTLIIGLQVDPGPISPVPTRQTQELEAVKGDSEGDISNAKEVATEPSLLTALFWKDDKIPKFLIKPVMFPNQTHFKLLENTCTMHHKKLNADEF